MVNICYKKGNCKECKHYRLDVDDVLHRSVCFLKTDLDSLIGKKIQIVSMKDESSYDGRVGIVESVDAIGQLHGTWGGCAIIPTLDEYVEIDE